MENKKETNVLKDAAKSFVKGVTFGSVFDPDLREEKANKTKEFTDKEIIEHLSGRKKLPDADIEELKRAAKYRGFL
ncbi:hypothetical protein ACPOM7_28870 [Peribacillus castrilensis]|uniref:hypothetical protein n=2 Tax=Bacillaceae TaxID=186817 RepID=UPI00137A13C7|nr:hypothetical protein [Peribacillus frigoritolerans]MCF7622486.1 hypothetical protein [Peribacillus frigoritolerans]MCP1096668.1 hypothetical protein [Bacillaceae bacterium OS4b]NCT38357.1 hypothetical protein [Peribacillus frigoritolerans]